MTDGGGAAAGLLSDLVAELRERGLPRRHGHRRARLRRRPRGGQRAVGARRRGGRGQRRRRSSWRRGRAWSAPGRRLGASAPRGRPRRRHGAAPWAAAPSSPCATPSADPRPRHRGVSHQTLTALRLGHAGPRAGPRGRPGRRRAAGLAGVAAQHAVVEVDVPDIRRLARRAGLAVTTMGRTPADDRPSSPWPGPPGSRPSRRSAGRTRRYPGLRPGRPTTARRRRRRTNPRSAGEADGPADEADRRRPTAAAGRRSRAAPSAVEWVSSSAPRCSWPPRPHVPARGLLHPVGSMVSTLETATGCSSTS